MLQHRLVPADTRLPLPAPVALDILQAASTIRDDFAWSPVTLPLLECFRACVAVCVNDTFFCRAESVALLRVVVLEVGQDGVNGYRHR